MNTSRARGWSVLRHVARSFFAAAVTASMLCCGADAPEGTAGAVAPTGKTQSTVVPPTPATPSRPESGLLSGQRPPARLSPGVEGILEMCEAGVSKGVIKAYVERSRVPCDPTPADLIALKEHAVPDEITTALLKRGAEARPAVAQVPANVEAPPAYSSPLSYAAFDPEGYDYFRSYYLLPRTLASVNERLSSYNAPFSYGYGPPLVFSPRFSGGYGQRHGSGYRRW